MIFEARHEPCGTVVADELPEGYPVEEGVGLWCGHCREAWWHVPDGEAVATPAPAPVRFLPPAPARVPDPAPAPAVAPPAVPPPEAAPAPPARDRRVAGVVLVVLGLAAIGAALIVLLA